MLIEAGELQFHVTKDDDTTAEPGTYTLNVVWKEALLSASDSEMSETQPPPAPPKRQLNMRAAFQRGRLSKELGHDAPPADVPVLDSEMLDEVSGSADLITSLSHLFDFLMSKKRHPPPHQPHIYPR